MRTLLKVISGVIIAWFGAICAITALHEAVNIPRGILSYIFLGAFVVGLFLFYRWRFVFAYVFGHEMTHYFTAKLFLKKTGKIKLHKTYGSVEVVDGNVWIVLAPYIIPFYSFVTVLVYGIASIFYSHPWMDYSFAALSALGYAYHIILTAQALRLQQTDLQIYGPFLSWAIIFAGNMLQILIAILVFSRTWMNALRYAQEITLAQVDMVLSLVKSLH
ncbi:MAG: hypothetical protein J5746_11680 [Victivallales bacterium]|nr:hypothetical protein [Victivallales bacterium]